MTRHITTLFAIIALILIAGIPLASAGNAAGSRVIWQGDTVSIGEENLNVTAALNSAAGKGAVFTKPDLTVIGWWASAATIKTTAPTKTLDLAGRDTSFPVASADFSGYTGDWYLLGSDDQPANDNALVFRVQKSR